MIINNLLIILVLNSCIMLPYTGRETKVDREKKQRMKLVSFYDYERDDYYSLIKLRLPSEINLGNLPNGLSYDDENESFLIEFLLDDQYFNNDKQHVFILSPLTKRKNPKPNTDFGIDPEIAKSVFEYKPGCRYLIPFPSLKGALKMKIYFLPGLEKTQNNESVWFEDSIVFEKKGTKTVKVSVSSENYKNIEWDEFKGVDQSLLDDPVTCD